TRVGARGAPPPVPDGSGDGAGRWLGRLGPARERYCAVRDPIMWTQREITLSARPRGFHLVTREVLDALPELDRLGVGLLHLLIAHTSASLALNENASPD